MSKRSSPPGGKSGQAGNVKVRSERRNPSKLPARNPATAAGSRRKLPGRPAPAPWFDERYFAADATAPLHRKLRDIYIKLDDDAATTPLQMEVYYEHSDKIRDALAEGFYAIDAAAAKEDEREARKIVAKLTARVEDMLAGYHEAEREREAEQAEIRRLAVELYPDLAHGDFIIIGTTVISAPPGPARWAKK
ncbi:MAG: hypothetical protein C0480_04245 [Bradyrhizobium sp.]|nr:hypothetical protein [Bradyrhizobium sp.]